jgi:hypothetical protein
MANCFKIPTGARIVKAMKRTRGLAGPAGILLELTFVLLYKQVDWLAGFPVAGNGRS